MLKRFLYISIGLVFISNNLTAQNISFSATAPQVVALGDQFRITYKINKEGKNFSLAAIQDFDILMGPSTSRSMSTQIIKGKMTTERSISFSYILAANRLGTFTIPPAKINVKGKEYSSNALNIKVVKTNQQNAPTSSGRTNNQIKNKQPTISSDTRKNFFVRLIFNKTSLYKGEHLIATIKIYSKYNQIGNLTYQPPAFAGFLSQEIKNAQSIEFKQEDYRGDIYNTAILSRFVLFPQREGKIKIDQVEVGCNARQLISSGNFFDDFFGRNFKDIQVNAKSPTTSIYVKNLPANKPSDFSGGVGKFKLNANINKDSIQANEAITLNVKIQGNGNLKLLNPLKFNFPNDFEVYDPEKTQKIKNSIYGTSGSVSYKYLLIPRFGGKYTIPSTRFSYFDLRSKTYKYLSTPKFNITVAKGQNDNTKANITSFSKEDVKFLGSDIRFIKTKNFKLFSGNLFFGTQTFYLFFILSLILFLLIIIIYRKILRNAGNFEKQKFKKASKVAKKRLQKAKSSLKTYDKHTFYDNLLDALWGYTSDKFNIPKAKLSKENISAYLTQKKINEETKTSFLSLLKHSEYAQYSPGTQEKEMDKIYAEAIELISKIENEYK